MLEPTARTASDGESPAGAAGCSDAAAASDVDEVEPIVTRAVQSIIRATPSQALGDESTLLTVLVSHPHLAAVSAEVAASFERDGRLAMFVTGIALNERAWTGRLGEALSRRRPVVNNRIVRGIAPGRLRSLAVVELGARASARVLGAAGLGPSAYDAMFVAHDAAVAALPWPQGLGAIYAYEDGALRTFRRAARSGIARVLDVASLNYRTLEEIWRREVRRWPGAIDGAPHQEPPWKRRRKDAELGLATRVSVASAFTRASLERAGVAAPVAVTPYGFPVELFPARTTRPSGPFTVLAVGAQSLTKGTPDLLEAWKRAAIPGGQLHLIGAMRLAKSFLDGYAGLFHHAAHVPRSELAARYASADLLAFPTLADGFGLVMQEAMCCGTPVVTTSCGGGPECITDGRDGWLVPAGDVDALAERLRACAAERDRLFEVGQAARARAERWTWREAGASLARALEL
jgi:glycosyltransferase involved in cell wall biosynthesis